MKTKRPKSKAAFGHFGDYLKYQRQRLDISQSELSERCGLDRSQISNLETKGNPAFETILKIAGGMNLTVEEFFQLGPKEANVPNLIAEFKNGATRDAWMRNQVDKNKVVALPLLNSTRALEAKVIEESDVDGYIFIDRKLLGPLANHRLVVMPRTQNIRFPFIIVDMDDVDIQDGQVYLVEAEGTRMRKIFLTENGMVLEPLYPDMKPIALFGRARDFLKVYGKVAYTCNSLAPTP